MRTLFSLFLFCCFSLILISCNSKSTQKTNDNFSDFAKEEKFKEAHQTPKPVENGDLMGRKVSFDAGSKPGSAYFVPTTNHTNNFLFVVHEWWGLNDNVRKECDHLFKELGETVNILAIDLYDGKSTADRDEAGKLMQGVKPERCNEIIQGAIAHVGKEARIGSVGWCFGGGWSLQTSIMAGDQGAACVIYYGMPEKDARKIAPLKADVLGIFASEDQWITPKVEQEFKNLMAATGKSLETHSFKAGHAFANPSGDNFNNEAAQKANEIALNFLKERLN